MAMAVQWRSVASILSSPRYATLLVSVILLVYILIYLLGMTPASSVSRKRSEKGAQSPFRTLRTRFSNKNDLDGIKMDVPAVPVGEGVWINDRSIQVISAIYDLHSDDGPRIMLPSLMKHSSKRDFVCCFEAADSSVENYQVPATLHSMDVRYIVLYQDAAFTCKLPSKDGKEVSYSTVSFSPTTCAGNTTQRKKIFYPKLRKFEFAVCTKVAYGRIDSASLVEWFEIMKDQGASKIVTFHNNLHLDTRRIFDFYEQQGVLEMFEYWPQSKQVLFTEDYAQTRQARHDKTLVVRDCQYRLAGYDFVMTIDFDELAIPVRPYGTVNWLFEDLMQNFTDAAAFRMKPILLPPEGRVDTDNALYHMQFHKGTYIRQYCMKWIYVPSRAYKVQTHEVYPRKGYKIYDMPQDKLHFLHFRKCKSLWADIDCDNLKLTVKNENSLLRSSRRIVSALRLLPLNSLVQDKVYVRNIFTNND